MNQKVATAPSEEWRGSLVALALACKLRSERFDCCLNGLNRDESIQRGWSRWGRVGPGGTGWDRVGPSEMEHRKREDMATGD